MHDTDKIQQVTQINIIGLIYSTYWLADICIWCFRDFSLSSESDHIRFASLWEVCAL